MPLPRSAAIVAIQVGDIEVWTNELGDMLDNGSPNLTQGNDAPQALIRFEEHEEAQLSDAAFRRTEREEAFLWSWGIDLFQIFRREVALEARIGRSLNCRHRLNISTDGCVG